MITCLSKDKLFLDTQYLYNLLTFNRFTLGDAHVFWWNPFTHYISLFLSLLSLALYLLSLSLHSTVKLREERSRLYLCLEDDQYLLLRTYKFFYISQKNSVFLSLRLSLQEFKKILPNTFIYESILIKI